MRSGRNGLSRYYQFRGCCPRLRRNWLRRALYTHGESAAGEDFSHVEKWRHVYLAISKSYRFYIKNARYDKVIGTLCFLQKSRMIALEDRWPVLLGNLRGDGRIQRSHYSRRGPVKHDCGEDCKDTGARREKTDRKTAVRSRG